MAAPRKIIISSLLTASHLLNYSFVDSYSLCMHGILLKQFVFQLALEPEKYLREMVFFVFVFLIAVKSLGSVRPGVVSLGQLPGLTLSAPPPISCPPTHTFIKSREL